MNHTATHILHAALRQVLGDHVKQAGSLVTHDRLRFDFTHFSSVTADEKQAIENFVNERIRENHEVSTHEMDMDEAVKQGATAFLRKNTGMWSGWCPRAGFKRTVRRHPHPAVRGHRAVQNCV